MDQGEQPKPSWEEAFQGKDVARGRELVDKLLYEGVGLPVYDQNFSDTKVKVLVDRKPGEEDYTVRHKEENDRRLMGLVLPTESKNEFVYLGVNEGGFVFWAADDRVNDFNPDTSTSFEINWRRFGDYVNSSVLPRELEDVRLILKEEDGPARFMEVVTSAVQRQRERMQSVREKRATVREDLLKKLFGEQG